jgi:hypothetical protein
MDTQMARELIARYPVLHEASERERLVAPDYWLCSGLIRFPVLPADITDEMVVGFLESPFFLSGYLNQNTSGEDRVIVTLYEKRRPDPRPSELFHATRQRNVDQILSVGLLPGRAVGAPIRGRRFWESQHYIYASSTVERAETWFRQWLGEKEHGVILRVRRRTEVFFDPCSNDGDDFLGLILETRHVPSIDIEIQKQLPVASA